MAKFGNGLNREIVAEVNAGIIKEPCNTADRYAPAAFVVGRMIINYQELR